MASDRSFFLSGATLFRSDDASSFPAIFDKKSKSWRRYYDLWDFHHSATPIDEARARKIAGDAIDGPVVASKG